MAVAVALLMVLLALPIVSLLLRVPPAQLWTYVQQPVVVAALKLSLITSVFATLAVVALGLPVAYLLAMRDFRGKRLIEVLVELPIVLPPTVAGVGLLLAFGRAGLAGHVLSFFRDLAAVHDAGGRHRAVVRGDAVLHFGRGRRSPRSGTTLSRCRDDVACLSLMYTFWHVLLPIALPSVLAGAAMSWARALGEFGATITFAGNLMGRTQTMPLAVYSALQTDLNSAVALAVVLIVFSFAISSSLSSASRPGAQPSEECMLDVAVSKRLGGFHLDLALTAPARDTLPVVVGESGSGKSTLLRLLA